MTLDLGVNPPIFRVSGMTYGMEYYENCFGKIWVLVIGQIPNDLWWLLPGVIAVVLPM